MDPEVSKKTYIKIQMHLIDVDGNPTSWHEWGYERNDGYATDVDKCFFEDLEFGKDDCKIQLYNTAEYITLMNCKTYKIEKRLFQPCVPCMLHIYMSEITE